MYPPLGVAMTSPLRVLFCVTVTQNFFDLPQSAVPGVLQAFGAALANLPERFGITLVGTLDDDVVDVGAVPGRTTAYILADAPDVETVRKVCNVFRTTPVGEHLLWRYGNIETRIGRQASGFKV